MILTGFVESKLVELESTSHGDETIGGDVITNVSESFSIEGLDENIRLKMKRLGTMNDTNEEIQLLRGARQNVVDEEYSKTSVRFDPDKLPIDLIEYRISLPQPGYHPNYCPPPSYAQLGYSKHYDQLGFSPSGYKPPKRKDK